MSLLSKATRGVKIGPQINVIVGTEGVGKSTFASKFPAPFFADLEDGSEHIDTTRLGSSDLPTYESLVEVVEELLNTEHNYETLVIDSITVLESYIHLSLTNGEMSIEEYAGGYGKGFTRSREIMTEFMTLLKKLRDKKGMTINLVGHTQVRAFSDPIDNLSYDRYIIQAHEKFSQIIKSQSNNVYFCIHQVSVMEDKKTKKKLAFGSGERIMRTEWRAGAEAKNRLNLPYELPLDYNAYCKAIEDCRPKAVEDIIKNIKEITVGFDKELKETVYKKIVDAGGNAGVLMKIKERALELVNQ